ncbi:MAG: Excinuclease ABC C subunit domain protein [Parcubacteria group bacterium GW2011_GWA1_47_11]|nr:MAG: Excinuclease ABC C subunit domain protein [Parcubacteria group bacterium GW2011_GWA1_47_11]
MEYAKLKKLNLPDKPGVYFFVKGGKILYIGKATSLRARVRSYFNPDLYLKRGPITVEMVAEARGVKWEVTGSVLEALILEANLIKKYKPDYNIKEKDDKSFNYVVITKEKLPKVIVVRGRVLEKYKGSVFGPYTSSRELWEAMKIIRRIFPYLDEKSKNYLEFYRQINLAPDLSDTKLYKQNIKNIKLFFSGRKRQILRNLKKEMKVYAKAREFEKAGELKRQLFALQHINDVALLKNEGATVHNFSALRPSPVRGWGGTLGQLEILNGSTRIEAYDIAHMGGKNMVGVMTVLEGGEPAKNEYRKFKIRTQTDANDTGALREVLERRLSHSEWRYPDLIVVDGSTAQINAARKALEKAGMEIPVVSVVKDEHHRPKSIGGDKILARKYEAEILLGNSEAHRFAIAYHKKMRGKNFLP